MEVVVLMGGNSSEREVSLASGNAVLASLKNSNIDCFSFDWCGDNLQELWGKTFDKVFIALHGKGGEDGYIQSLLEKKNIAYTGTNSTNSKNCLDKNITKQLCQTNNILTSNWFLLKTGDAIPKVSFPVAVKPTNEGSSIGISKANNAIELSSAIDIAFKYGNEIIIEEWISGSEYSVAIVKNQVFPVVEISVVNDFYDYEAKYQTNTTHYQIPANLDQELTKKLQTIAKKVFNIMGMKDWGRIDFIKDNQGNFYLLEVNTIPGMTNHSLVPKVAKQMGISFDELVLKILQ